jgi:hypothetical protein
VGGMVFHPDSPGFAGGWWRDRGSGVGGRGLAPCIPFPGSRFPVPCEAFGSRRSPVSFLTPDPWPLFPTSEVARSSAAYPRRWVRAGPGFPSFRIRVFSLPVLFPVLPGQVNRKDAKNAKALLFGPCGLCVFAVSRTLAVARPGVSAGWQPLLSSRGSSTREPAQHKDGFPSDREGNPVERAFSKATPGSSRPGENQCDSQALQRGWG